MLMRLICLLAFVAATFAARWQDRQSRVVQPHTLSRRAPAKYKYSSIVAIGASYQDNAHPREAKYRTSQRDKPYAQGRFTNGPVAVEHLASSLKVPLFDYAYGGSVIDNQIPDQYKDLPDSGDQVDQYLAAVAKKTVKRGSGRVLHVIWTGINPLTIIWNQWQKDKDVATAMARVDENVAQLAAQIRNISELAAAGVAAVDFLLPTLPPMETMGNFRWAAIPVDDKKQLAQLGQFRQRFEKGLTNSIKALQKNKSFAKSRVLRFDTVAWWNSVMKNPKKAGFTNVSTPCYDTSTGRVCKTPATYFYFDSLHPTTAAFKKLAQAWQKSVVA